MEFYFFSLAVFYQLTRSTIYGQISNGVTDGVVTSTVWMTPTTSVTPTFTIQSTSTATPATTPTPPDKITTFEISVTVVNIVLPGGTFIDASDPDIFVSTTVTFITARDAFVLFVSALYSSDPLLGPSFLSITFITFKRGSIVADFTVQFKSNETVTETATSARLSSVIARSPNATVASGATLQFLPGSVAVSDFNECANSSSNNCHRDAICLNSLGSFSCACKSGTSGDGFTCTNEETNRTLLYAMIALVCCLVIILIVFIVVSIYRRRKSRKSREPKKERPYYPVYDFSPGELTAGARVPIPKARSIVLPPSGRSERYRFNYGNEGGQYSGWD